MRDLSAVSRAEKAAGLVILLLTAGVVAVFGWQVKRAPGGLFAVEPDAYGVQQRWQSRQHAAERSASSLVSCLPTEAIGGFVPPARIERFSPDELYVKIDGRAEFYLSFGVRELMFASFVHESGSQRAIDVYRYDMGSVSNARAVFEAEKPPEGTPVNIGDVGYQVAAAVYFCVGTYYVQVVSAAADEQDAAAARQIAEALAARLER